MLNMILVMTRKSTGGTSMFWKWYVYRNQLNSFKAIYQVVNFTLYATLHTNSSMGYMETLA